MAVVIALDAGTTGVRAFAVDESGRSVGYRYREFTQHFPKPGWVEHDAPEIWSAIVGTTAELIASLGQPVAAIGITNQRETIVAWDRRTGAPRHRAIVWQDRRGAARCDELTEAGHLPLVRSTTGLVLDPYFSATKAEWLFTEGGLDRDDPDLALGTIDTWLIWKLTEGKVHVTEPSNASRTMLFDIRELGWSGELCDLFGVPRAALPDVRPSSGRFGVTHESSGLPPGIPIAGIAGDQQAALIGQACFEPGATKSTYGTGSFVLMNVGTECPEPVEGLLSTVAWTIPDGSGGTRTDYAFEGAIFSTGSAIQWLRDGLGIIRDAKETGPLAASVPDTDDVFFVPAFTGLGSPWWDPYARGTLVGVTRGTTKAHLARAVVESMVLQTRDVVDAMTAHAGRPVTELKADGGATAMDLLLQLQADQLGVTVRRPVVQETTALGAAYLAGLAEGVWSSTDDIEANWVLDAEFTPEADRAAVDAHHARWLRSRRPQPRLGPPRRRMAALTGSTRRGGGRGQPSGSSLQRRSRMRARASRWRRSRSRQAMRLRPATSARPAAGRGAHATAHDPPPPGSAPTTTAASHSAVGASAPEARSSAPSLRSITATHAAVSDRGVLVDRGEQRPGWSATTRAAAASRPAKRGRGRRRPSGGPPRPAPRRPGGSR